MLINVEPYLLNNGNASFLFSDIYIIKLNQFYLHILLQLHIVLSTKYTALPAFLTIFLFYLNYPEILALLPLFVIAHQMAVRRYIAHREHDFIKNGVWVEELLKTHTMHVFLSSSLNSHSTSPHVGLEKYKGVWVKHQGFRVELG